MSKNYILPPMLAGEVAKRSFDGGVVTIQTADCRQQTTDIGSSETADPYNVILSVSEESRKNELDSSSLRSSE